MTALEWNDNMATGIPLVDKRHRELVALINDIARAVEGKADKTVISDLIRRFIDYTMIHFREEESLMDHLTYPDYFQQVYEHLDCSTKAVEFHKRFITEDNFEVSELMSYITTWFVNHTTGIDQTLMPYLVEHKKLDRAERLALMERKAGLE